MKKLLALVVIAVAALTWLAWDRASALAALPPEAAEAERRLALPGLVALVTVNVEALVTLEETLHGRPSQTLPPVAEDLDGPSPWRARAAEAAGIDLRRDVSHLTTAIYARPDRDVGFAVALFGDFDADAIRRALEEDPAYEVALATTGGASVLEIMTIDRDTCEESGPYHISVDGDRLLVADPDSMAALLGPAGAAGSAPTDLARFQDFREDMLASAAVFVPDEIPGVENPFVTGLAMQASNKLDGFRAIYLGGGLGVMPPGLKLASVLEAEVPGRAAAAASSLQALLGASQAEWASTLPTLAALHDTLAVAVDGDELQLDAFLDREAAEQIGNLPGEALQLAFGGLSSGMSFGMDDGDAPREETLDEDPMVFAAEASAESLAPYAPGTAFAGPVDFVTGPFGVRVATLALPEDPEQGPELSIETLGTALPNLGDRGARAHLFVTSVRGIDGSELLAQAACGAQRNDRPEALVAQFDDELFQATKKVRLVHGASIADVAGVAGHVRLRLPVRTEAVRLSDPAQGMAVERSGSRLEITKASPSAVGWNVSGALLPLLHLRALDARGRPLLRQSSSEMGSMFGGGKSGSMDYMGTIAHVEAIFALEEEIWEYPFDLTSLTPGTSGEYLTSQSVTFFDFPLKRLARDFERAVARALPSGSVAQAATGPFTVTLERMWNFRGLNPHLKLKAPDVPNLESSLNGLEVVLDRISMRDGTFHTLATAEGDDPAWSSMVDLRRWGDEGLTGTVELRTGAEAEEDAVARLDGRLVVRLPKRVATFGLEPLDLGKTVLAAGISVTLVEIGRDRFVLRARRGGERILAVKAFNAAGQELQVPGGTAERVGAGWRGEFGVQGVPARLELVVAKEVEKAEYPFALRLDGSV